LSTYGFTPNSIQTACIVGLAAEGGFLKALTFDMFFLESFCNYFLYASSAIIVSSKPYSSLFSKLPSGIFSSSADSVLFDVFYIIAG